MVTLDDIRAAQQRVRGAAVRTPLVICPQQDPVRRVYLKAENFQPMGAFKIRGAYNKLAALGAAGRWQGVITYSSGNHAQAVAWAARAFRCKAVVVMPRNAPRVKQDATRLLGGEVVLVGPSSSERQDKAEQLAMQHGYTIVPPFNDEQIIAGQGTIGIEILEDFPDVELVLVPVSGGGLLSGVATAIKLLKPSVKVIGVEPELAADAQASLRSGTIVHLTPEQALRTIADGLRTLNLGEIPFEHIQQYVDDIVTVRESEILAAMRHLALGSHLVAEPSGAVSFAAWLFHRDELPPVHNVVAVVSGGNVEAELLAQAIHGRQSPDEVPMSM